MECLVQFLNNKTKWVNENDVIYNNGKAEEVITKHVWHCNRIWTNCAQFCERKTIRAVLDKRKTDAEEEAEYEEKISAGSEDTYCEVQSDIDDFCTEQEAKKIRESKEFKEKWKNVKYEPSLQKAIDRAKQKKEGEKRK